MFYTALKCDSLTFCLLKCSSNCGPEGDVRVGQASPLKERGATVIVESSQGPAVRQLAQIGVLGLECQRIRCIINRHQTLKSLLHSSLTSECALATERHCTHCCALDPSLAFRTKVRSWVKISKALGMLRRPSLVTFTERMEPTSNDFVMPVSPLCRKRKERYQTFIQLWLKLKLVEFIWIEIKISSLLTVSW